MDTEEMYRRGIADAERGEPHPFYYEHYYQYRRGYDRARRSRGLPGGFYERRRRRVAQLGALALVLAVGAGGLWLWRNRAGQMVAAQAPAQQTTGLAATSVPTRTPVFTTPTQPLTPTPPALRVGGNARVTNTGGAALRGRKQPMLNAATTTTFKEGDHVTILEGPVEADGFTWWRVEGGAGAGWSAQQSKDGVVWLQADGAS